jgi:hypothetical protein
MDKNPEIFSKDAGLPVFGVTQQSNSVMSTTLTYNNAESYTKTGVKGYAANTWYMMTIVVKADASVGINVNMYQNRNIDATSNDPAGNVGARIYMDNAGYVLGMGGCNFGPYASMFMYDFRIFNAAWTATEYYGECLTGAACAGGYTGLACPNGYGAYLPNCGPGTYLDGGGG